MKPHYTIRQVERYKGLEVKRIEAHDGYDKKTCAINPDIGTSMRKNKALRIHPDLLQKHHRKGRRGREVLKPIEH